MNEIKSLVKLWKNLSRKRHKQLIFIFLLMILSGILEVISLSSILPFLYAIIEPEKLLSIKFINDLSIQFNINSSRDILIVSTLIFSGAIIISASIRLFNLWINARFIASLGSDLSSKIYESILYKNYNYHINNNSSKLIKNITANVDGTMLAVNSILQLGTAFFITLGIILNPRRVTYASVSDAYTESRSLASEKDLQRHKGSGLPKRPSIGKYFKSWNN